MAGYAAATVQALQALQLMMVSLQTQLGLGGYLCPTSSTIDAITSISSFDYIIVGAGEAGSIVTYRLAETNASILVLEEGGCPPLESVLPGLFTTLPLSETDRAMNIFNDGYASQNIKPDGGATAGKMLGGTSGIQHMIYVPGVAKDYEAWGTAAGDDSWAFPDLEYYFVKGENVLDQQVLEQNSNKHGTCGPTLLKRQENPLVEPLIKANEEMGFPYLNDSYGQCTNQPLLMIGDCGVRQSGTASYLSKLKENKNVRFLTGAVATKILFSGTTATGVEFTHNGSTYKASASSKVIVSAGAFKSPQLLMLSGIGDSEALKQKGIETIVDNKEVGQNLMDHVAAVYGVALDKGTPLTDAADPHNFPVPMLTKYAAQTTDKDIINGQDIVLYFPPASNGLLQLCSYGFKYRDPICDAWYKYNLDRNMVLVIPNLMHPVSRGSVTLNTTNILDQPIIKLNLLSNKDDLENLAAYVKASAEIINTETLKSLGAEFVDPGVCSDVADKTSLEYFECYALEMSSTMWHYSGTCMLGKVVDASLSVKGTNNLKVVDASIMPYLPSGNIASAVHALAEKASDIIKIEDGHEI